MAPSGASRLSFRQLCVRTCLARGVNLREYTDHSPEDLARLAASENPDDRRQLLDLFGLFTSEYDYRLARCKDLPYGRLIEEYASRHTGPVVHNHGAIASLERLLGLLDPGGFILVNDYGSVTGATSDEFEHQRYGSGSFVGLNFALLKEFFTKTESRSNGTDGGRPDPVKWAEPVEDQSRIYSRLLGHDLHPEVVDAFRTAFGKAAAARLEEPVQKARTQASQGRFEAAATTYRTALERQPWDWLLILEVANFLTFGLRDPRAGLEVARAGLELNPCCSPELWNAYGDALFALGRVGQAGRAYDRALAVNPDDVPARYNLAWVYLHRKEHAEALRVVGEALAKDWRGTYRDRLLQKQAEVLADLARRAQQEFQTLINRVSQYPGTTDGRGENPGDKPPGYVKDVTFKRP